MWNPKQSITLIPSIFYDFWFLDKSNKKRSESALATSKDFCLSCSFAVSKLNQWKYLNCSHQFHLHVFTCDKMFAYNVFKNKWILIVNDDDDDDVESISYLVFRKKIFTSDYNFNQCLHTFYTLTNSTLKSLLPFFLKHVHQSAQMVRALELRINIVIKCQ